MRVAELILLLSQYDESLEVLDTCYMPIDGVEQTTLSDINWPYNREDREVVKLV